MKKLRYIINIISDEYMKNSDEELLRKRCNAIYILFIRIKLEENINMN